MYILRSRRGHRFLRCRDRLFHPVNPHRCAAGCALSAQGWHRQGRAVSSALLSSTRFLHPSLLFIHSPGTRHSLFCAAKVNVDVTGSSSGFLFSKKSPPFGSYSGFQFWEKTCSCSLQHLLRQRKKGETYRARQATE